jgi:hypothetical protein
MIGSSGKVYLSTEQFQGSVIALSSTSRLWSTTGPAFFCCDRKSWAIVAGAERVMVEHDDLTAWDCLLVMVIIIDRLLQCRYVAGEYVGKLRLPGCHRGSEAGTLGTKLRSVLH